MGCCDSRHQNNDTSWNTNYKNKTKHQLQIAGGGAETLMVFKKRVVLNKAQAAQERLRKEHEALGIIAPMPKQSPPHVNQLSGMS